MFCVLVFYFCVTFLCFIFVRVQSTPFDASLQTFAFLILSTRAAVKFRFSMFYFILMNESKYEYFTCQKQKTKRDPNINTHTRLSSAKTRLPNLYTLTHNACITHHAYILSLKHTHALTHTTFPRQLNGWWQRSLFLFCRR